MKEPKGLSGWRLELWNGIMKAREVYGTQKGNSLSPKAKAAFDYIARTGFGCGKECVFGLVEILLGEKFPKLTEGIYYSGNVLVPIANNNNHNYPIGQPCLVREGRCSLLMMNGNTGNFLDSETGPVSNAREATDEEVLTFCEEVKMLPFLK